MKVILVYVKIDTGSTEKYGGHTQYISSFILTLLTSIIFRTVIILRQALRLSFIERIHDRRTDFCAQRA
jgi:uncharacterized membrane protein